MQSIVQSLRQRIAQRQRAGTDVRSHPAALRLPSSLWLFVGLGLLAALWVYWMVHEAQRGIGSYDFSTYYAAARALRLDPHSDIYAQSVLSASAAAGHVSRQPPLPYAYPPLGALLLLPLTLLPFAAAVHTWAAINLALWLTVTLLLAREIYALLAPALRTIPAAPSWLFRGLLPWKAVDRPSTRQALMALTLASLICLTWAPAADTIAFGQINFLILLPLALVPALLRSGHDGWAGAAIGVAAMLKVTPLLLLAYLALAARRQALVAALGTLAALAALTVSIVGPHVAVEAVGQTLHVGTYDTSLTQNEALLSPITLSLLRLVPAAAGIIRIGEYAVLAALAIWIGGTLWLRLGRATPRRENTFTVNDALAYAAALCGFVLVSPLAWLHHYLWLLPAAALALGVMLRRWLLAPQKLRQEAKRQLLFTLLAILLIGLPLPIDWDRAPWLANPHLLGMSLANWVREMRGCGALLLVALALAGLRRADDTGERGGPSGGRVAPAARMPYTVGSRAGAEADG